MDLMSKHRGGGGGANGNAVGSNGSGVANGNAHHGSGSQGYGSHGAGAFAGANKIVRPIKGGAGTSAVSREGTHNEAAPQQTVIQGQGQYLLSTPGVQGSLATTFNEVQGSMATNFNGAGTHLV